MEEALKGGDAHACREVLSAAGNPQEPHLSRRQSVRGEYLVARPGETAERQVARGHLSGGQLRSTGVPASTPINRRCDDLANTGLSGVTLPIEF